VLLLVAVVAAERVEGTHQTKAALIGAVAVAAVRVSMLVVAVVVVVRAVPDQAPLAVQVVPVGKVIQAVRVVGEVRQVVAATPLVVQTHALVVPAVVLASISLSIRL
jgi:hypothetical protein